MTIDRFWELLSKKHCGEVSTAEMKEFEELLHAHPEWKNAAETLSGLNFQSTLFEDSTEAEMAFEMHLNRMKKADVEFRDVESNPDIETQHRTRTSRKWLIPVGVVATGLILFFVLENIIGSSER